MQHIRNDSNFLIILIDFSLVGGARWLFIDGFIMIHNSFIMLDNVRYLLIAFRTKKAYMLFHISQLVLSVSIIAVALNSDNHFKSTNVLIMEFILLMTMALDL